MWEKGPSGQIFQIDFWHILFEVALINRMSSSFSKNTQNWSSYIILKMAFRWVTNKKNVEKITFKNLNHCVFIHCLGSLLQGFGIVLKGIVMSDLQQLFFRLCWWDFWDKKCFKNSDLESYFEPSCIIFKKALRSLFPDRITFEVLRWKESWKWN